MKSALGSITTNKASGGDGIPVELFQILKDDAVEEGAPPSCGIKEGFPEEAASKCRPGGGGKSLAAERRGKAAQADGQVWLCG